MPGCPYTVLLGVPACCLVRGLRDHVLWSPKVVLISNHPPVIGDENVCQRNVCSWLCGLLTRADVLGATVSTKQTFPGPAPSCARVTLFFLCRWPVPGHLAGVASLPVVTRKAPSARPPPDHVSLWLQPPLASSQTSPSPGSLSPRFYSSPVFREILNGGVAGSKVVHFFIYS